MRLIRVAGLIAALGTHSAAREPNQNPLAWFPLQPGSRWMHEYEWKSGDRNRPDVDRWITEETVIGTVTIPEGLVVLREVKPMGASNSRIITRWVRLPYRQYRSGRKRCYRLPRASMSPG